MENVVLFGDLTTSLTPINIYHCPYIYVWFIYPLGMYLSIYLSAYLSIIYASFSLGSYWKTLGNI